MKTELEKKFLRLVEIMERLRQECPWDQAQTPESLRKYLLEEAYEVVETIDRKEWDKLGEELGDLLLQILFQSVIAGESDKFTIETVIDNISKKLVERHPHVYGNKKVESARDVETNWEHIKIKREKRKSLLDGVPQAAPALLRAQRLQERAARVAFDWKDIKDVIAKIEEELNELKGAIEKKEEQHVEEETGDILFSIVNLARFLNISAEDALRKGNDKFTRRFNYVEKAFNNDYEKMKKVGLTALDKMWNEAKKSEK